MDGREMNNLKFSKQDLKRGVQFLGILLLTYIILFFATQPFIPSIQLWISILTQKMLSLVGVQSQLVNGDFIGLSVEGKKIEISFICTGVSELILLISAILATTNIEWRKRILGIGIGIIFIILFNQLRIFFTIMQLLTTSLQFAELIHSVLFRIFLVACLAGFYYVWNKEAGKGSKGF